MNDQTTATMMSLLPLILIFVIFYFMLIRPQKKRDKETARMRANLEVGEDVYKRQSIDNRSFHSFYCPAIPETRSLIL